LTLGWPCAWFQRLKLKFEEPLSDFALNFKLRRYIEEEQFKHRAGVKRAHAEAAKVGAVQLDPIRPVSKPPGTMRLKQKHGSLLSSFAFKSNLRHYTKERTEIQAEFAVERDEVRRCRLTLSNPR